MIETELNPLAPMQTVEEGDVLIVVQGGGDRGGIETPKNQASITDRCLDNPKSDVIYLYTFCLAMGNAADAVEIICIGYIMTELNVSQTDKGIHVSIQHYV